MERPTGDAEEMQRRVAENVKNEREERKQLEREEMEAAKRPVPRIDPKVLQQQQMDRLLKR
jgi:hypothetical protein